MLLFVPGFSRAETPKKDLTVEEITQKVDEAQSGVKDAQMDLRLEMKDALSGAQQHLKGRVKLKSTNMVFVHYSEPEAQDLYLVGNLAQMYQPSQKMVYRQQSSKADTPLYLGVGRELKRYVRISKVTLIKNTGDEVGLLFKPKSAESGFDEMKVFIRKKDWWPIKMEMSTPSMTTKAEFSQFSFNQGLKDELFRFKVPKGVEVVEGAVF